MKDKVCTLDSVGRLIGLALCCMILVGAFLSLYFMVLKPKDESGAFTSSNSDNAHFVFELLNNTSLTSMTQEERKFNKTNLTALVNLLSNSTDGTLEEQVASLTSSLTEASDATSPVGITAETLRGYSKIKAAGKSIVVRLGGLDWIVTYVSTDKDNKNLIATLWLSNNHQEAWANKTDGGIGLYYGFVKGGLYSDWSANWSITSTTTTTTYPSNMYGTSYIRAGTLNNGGTYATSDSATATVSQSESNPFALYTMSQYGLTSYLSTPNQMKWINNYQNPAKRHNSNYWLNNESLTSNSENAYGYSASDGWYSKSGISYCYESKTGYSAWGSDTLWLPSMAETGHNDTYNGLWATNTAERSTYDGITESLTSSSSIGTWSSGSSSNGTTAEVATCTRSACSNLACYGVYLEPEGGGWSWLHVDRTYAVRPALLLNLTSAISNATTTTTSAKTITLNKNDGTGATETINTDASGVLPSSVSVPSYAYHKFNGYYTGINGTGNQIYDANGKLSADGIVSSNTTLYAGWTDFKLSELLNDPTTAVGDSPFNKQALTEFVNTIYGSTGDITQQVKSLTSSTATTPLTATALRTKTMNKNNGESITVRLGGLDWIVTYVSNDTSGNLIATLWLDNNHQEAWGWDGTGGSDVLTNQKNVGSYCAIVNGGLYSDWSANWTDYDDYTDSTAYPSNMYGTSYIRAETLNNGGVYATSNNESDAITQSESSPFALYTMDKFGLTQYLSTPNQMKWMNNRQNPAKRNDSYYWLNNESLKSDNDYNYSAFSGWYSSDGISCCYESKAGYSAWGSDTLWLPSTAETGYKDTYNGLWATNTAERSTYDGSTTSLTSSSSIGTSSNGTTAYVYSWSRSAERFEASSSFYLASTSDYCRTHMVDVTLAVRPALLLNLTSIVADTKIYLDQQGGSGLDIIGLLEKDTTLPTIAPPTRTGYNFAGYYTEQNGGGTLVYNADGTPALSVSTSVENKTIYAKWVGINITLENQGATTSGTTSLIATYNEELPEITPPTKTGYLFLGYYTDTNGNGTQVYNSDGTPSIVLSAFENDTTLYADWAQNTSTITFDDNGATTPGSLSSISIDYGATLPTVETVPTKTGCTFCGYYAWGELGYETLIYKADGTPAVAKSTFKYDTTLYAVWSPVSLYDYIKSDFEYKLTNPYTVRNSASVNWTAVAPENSADLPKNAGVTGGYIKSTNEGKSSSYSGFAITFTATCSARLTVSYMVNSYQEYYYGKLMLYVNSSEKSLSYYYGRFNTTFTTITFDISAGSNGSNTVEFYYRKSSTSSSDTTDDCVYISLITIEKLYTITLDNQSASSSGTASVSVTNGSAMPNITVPTKTGYAFGGYYTSTNGSGTKIYNTDGTPAIAESTFNSNTTLYAYWIPTRTITLDNQSATILGDTSVKIGYGLAMPNLEKLPTKTGYSFGGFYTSKNGVGTKVYNSDGTPAIAESTFNSNTTLYAYWVSLITIALDNQSATIASDSSVQVAYGFAMPNLTELPAKTGYNFGGYYTETNGGGTKVYNSDGTPAIAESTFAKSTTLYALWGTYLINVNANIELPASYITGAGAYAYGTIVSIGVYAMNGYNFLYWLKDGVKINNTNHLSVIVNGNAQYTAVFAEAGKIVPYITVTSTGGGIAYIEGQNFAELQDSDTIIVKTKPCVVGYKFVGWYLDNDRTKVLSNDTSFSVTKAVAKNHVLVAVYQYVEQTEE